MDHFPDHNDLCNEIKNGDAMLDEHAADFEEETFEDYLKKVHSADHVLDYC